MNLIGSLLSLTSVSPLYSLTTSPISLGVEIASLSMLNDVLSRIKSYAPKSFSLFPSVGFGAFSPSLNVSLVDPVYTTAQVPTLPNVNTSVINVPLIIKGEELEIARLITLIQKALLLKSQEYLTRVQLEQLKEHTKLVKDDITKRKEVIADLNGQISELDKAIRSLRAQLKRLEANARITPTLRPVIEQLRRQLAELRRRRAELVRQRRAQERLLKQDERLLADLERRTSKLRATLSRLVAKLSELEGNITRIEGKIKTDDLFPELKRAITEAKRVIRAKLA